MSMLKNGKGKRAEVRGCAEVGALENGWMFENGRTFKDVDEVCRHRRVQLRKMHNKA